MFAAHTIGFRQRTGEEAEPAAFVLASLASLILMLAIFWLAGS